MRRRVSRLQTPCRQTQKIAHNCKMLASRMLQPASSSAPYTQLPSTDEALLLPDEEEELVEFKFPLHQHQQQQHQQHDQATRSSTTNIAYAPADGFAGGSISTGSSPTNGKSAALAMHAVVKEAISDLVKDSHLFKIDDNDAATKRKSPATIDMPSRVGRKLGQGGFCQVHEFLVDEISDTANEEDFLNSQSRTEKAIKFVSRRSSPRTSSPPAVTALMLEDGGNEDDTEQQLNHRQYMIGTIDLIREAHFLSRLQHPNLIRMHGMMRLPATVPCSATRCRVETNFPSPEHFFIVLDRLGNTLEEHILLRPGAASIDSLSTLLQRLQWGLQIAQVLAYLHSQRIVYRDLKLSNIGLSQTDSGGKGLVVKLFDLGLAKELKPCLLEDKKAINVNKYRLSGKTGSFHTMPPEVAKCWAYNEKVDVYSFGIILWELLMGRRAFVDGVNDEGILTEEEYVRRVVNGNERPTPLPKDEWSPELCDLLERCWSFFPNARPTMAVVVRGMQCLVSQVQAQIDRHKVARRARLIRRVCLSISLLLVLLAWYHLYSASWKLTS